ncbi:MAG: hypothetical protein IJY90_03445 [Clostridia bacterium]|nr:hypothetical protein [Clostridia bacterium]
MKHQNLSRSITLIGPSSVGKSLLAMELAKKTGFKNLCIDDLITVVRVEKEGLIGPEFNQQQAFVDRCIKDIQSDSELSYLLKNKRYRSQELQLIDDFVGLYNYYLNMFGNLQPFYDAVEMYDIVTSCYEQDIDYVNVLELTSSAMLDTAFMVLDEPLIIDAPAAVGWKTKDNLRLSGKVKAALRLNGFTFNEEKIRVLVSEVLDVSTTVFICPGLDYAQRNSEKKSGANNIILADLNAYENQADIMISANGLFNNPSHYVFQKRSWFDAQERLKKEELKNKGEIANVCDQILEFVDELSLEK